MRRELRTLASIVALGVLVACCLAFPLLAAAAPVVTGPATFSARTPADGSSVGVVRPPISVKAYDVKGLAGSPYYSMKVDGLAQTATFSRTDANNVTLSFTPRADMANGTHTVYVSVKNNAGVYSTTTWSFTVSRAPLPSAPSPIPGSTVNLTNPVVSVTVGGATAGLTSVVLLDGTAVPATFNAGTGVLSAPTSGLANDASHDVTVTVTNSSGNSATLAWSFSVQIYADMPTPASGCVACHPGFPDAHPMANCLSCHGPGSPVGEGWNTPDYGPHAASYIAQDANSCVTCHTSGYATVPPLHSMTSGATSHNSAGACSPCHVKSLTTEHYRYGKTCFTCHASTNPLVAAAVATGRTDCEACHPNAASHTTVHETPVAASCAGAGCHTGSGLTEVHAKSTCDTCHKSTDERVIAAIAGSVKTCDACHSTASHEAQHATAVTPTCAGAGCHAGTSLTGIHINADGKYSCATCHKSTDADVIAAIAANDKSCTACHDAAGHGPAHDAAVSAGCAGAGCHAGTNLTTIHTGTCASCHSSNDPRVTTAIAANDKSCTACHDNHPDLGALHASNVTSASFTILGSAGGTHACSECHASDVRDLHPSGCATCHPTLDDAVRPWDKTCAGASCHGAGSARPQHADLNGAHAIGAKSCATDGCHAGAGNAAAIHATQGCVVCHGAGKTPTTDCASCHNLSDPHAGVAQRHASTGGADNIGATHGDSVYMNCSDCHTMSLIPLHANYCDACHGSTASAAVKNAIATHTTACTACHPSQHSGDVGAHDSIGYSECGPCHGNGCTGCHSAWTPAPNPSTTSDAKPTYINDATINLFASDGVYGSFGIKSTYYTLDGSAATNGTQISVPAPATGSVAHTLRFWSTDWSGTVETAKTAVFTVTADSFPPVTTSNVVLGKTYAGDVTFTLAATDANSQVAGTWWQLDGTTGPWTPGSSVLVTAPPSGTVAHTLYFYSKDSRGNNEVTKSASFSVLAGKDVVATGADQTWVVPSGVTTIAVTMSGGSGGNSVYVGGTYALGGPGGRVNAVIPVTPGSTLTMRVGRAGGSCSPWGDAGVAGWPNGARGNQYGGGGGGSSSMWLGSTELAEAGAGGGAGSSTGVGVGGAGGIQGTLPGGYKPGTYSASYGAGGGGGGWNAGSGGSGTYRGGTGGTSYIVAGTGTVTSGANVGDGSLTIRYAVAGAGPFSLTYSAGSGGTLMGTTSQSVAKGASGTLVTAVANTGYHFVNWSDGVATATRTDTNVTTNLSVTANFAINTYTLTYTAGPGGSIGGTNPQTVNYNASGALVNAAPSAGYHFVNWSDGLATQTRTDTNVTANKSVTANFAINTYTLTYTAGTGGVVTGTNPQTVNYYASGSAVTAVPNAGYQFLNWSDGVTAATRTDANVIANKSVTANFVVEVYYSITALAGTGGSISPAGAVSALTASSPSFTITPDSGYRISQVVVDGVNQGAVASYTFSGVSANHTISATFAAIADGTQVTSLSIPAVPWMDASWDASAPFAKFDIYADGRLIGTKIADGTSTWQCPETVVSSGARIDIVTTVGFANGGSIYDESGPVTHTMYLAAGSSRLEAATWSGFPTFTSSDGNDGWDWGYPENDYHWVAVYGASVNNIVYVVGTPTSHTLTYAAGANGTISGTSPQTVATGGSGTPVTAVANTNYHFVNWSDGVATATRTDSNVTANKSVIANFAINTYTLTYTAGTGGTITGTTPQTVTFGTNGSAVTAVASTGYQFVSWSDGVTTATRTDTNVRANKSVTASFAPYSYTLSYTAGANGTISGTTPQTVAYSASGTAVTAVANAGYHFMSWSDGVATASRTDANITANKSVSASFAANPDYTISASSGAGGSVSPAGAVTVRGGLSKTFTISSNSGYIVSQVLVDGVNQGAIGTYTFANVASAHTISATFAPVGAGMGAGGFNIAGIVPWVDSELGSGGAWGLFTIYANGVKIGTKVADGTPTWTCPQTVVPSGARIDIVAQCGFTSGYSYDENPSVTYSMTLPAGSTRLEAATWYGFPDISTGDGTDGSEYGYPSSDFSSVWIAGTSITNVVYSATAPSYTLTYAAGTNGSISGTSPQTVTSGGSGTAVTAVASTGHHFVSWSDGVTTATRTDSNVTASKSVTANFAVNTYTLAYTAGTGGTITGTSPQTVNYNASGSAVTAVANTGYHFVSWSDGVTTASRTDASVTANKSVTATFASDTGVGTLRFVWGDIDTQGGIPNDGSYAYIRVYNSQGTLVASVDQDENGGNWSGIDEFGLPPGTYSWSIEWYDSNTDDGYTPTGSSVVTANSATVVHY